MQKTLIGLLAAAALALATPVAAQQKAPEAAKPAEKAPEKAPEKKAEPPKAAEKAPEKKPEPKVSVPYGAVFYKGQGPTQYLARDRLIGMKVLDAKGAVIGDIEDLVMGANDNNVQGVIIGVGGFLGVGEKKVGVRYSALKFATDKDGKRTVSLNTTKEVLTAVEPYQRLEPKKGVAEKAKEAAKKAGEVAKDAAKKAGEATKSAVEKAKDALKKDETKKDEPKKQ